MSSYFKYEVILIKYPFTDLTVFKVRPAVIVNSDFISDDLFIVPLTSRTIKLQSGEFILSEWKEVGLNVQTAVKRGIFTIDVKLVIKKVAKLKARDIEKLENSLRFWLDLY